MLLNSKFSLSALQTNLGAKISQQPYDTIVNLMTYYDVNIFEEL